MKKIKALMGIAALLLAGSAIAATPRDTLVVNTAWLAAHINDGNLVLLHVGNKDDFKAAHIPGARLVTFENIAVTDESDKGLILEMPKPDDLRHRLEALGISEDSHVIVYYGKDWVSPTTRVIFTLDYAGLGEGTSLLDGGMPAWVRDGHAVTKETHRTRKGKLAALKIRPIVVDADFVRANAGKPGIALIDGRARSFFDGVEAGGMADHPHRKGHIQGAGSFPFTEITDESFMLRSPAELQALLAKAGVKPGDAILGYCHIGQQVTAPLFVARTLGYRVLLYDGAMQDWSRHAGFPVDDPTARAGK